MFKKITQFLRKVEKERKELTAWTFNRYIWYPQLTKVVPQNSLKELTAQPMFKHVTNLPIMGLPKA